MIPFMFAPPDSDDPAYALRNRKLVIVGLLTAIAFAFGLLLVVRAGSGAFMAIFPIILIVMIALVMVLVTAGRQAGIAKEKRRPQGADMYTLIDRMVDDLDDDEAAYLRRRLDAREADMQNDLPADMQDLLDQREQDRRAGRR